jgi:hypothetical protein
MAVKPSEKRTRHIPLWVFFVYGLVALLIVGIVSNLTFYASSAPSIDNPFGLPFWVFQVLFVFTAVSGVASFVRWMIGAVNTVIRFFARK